LGGYILVADSVGLTVNGLT